MTLIGIIGGTGDLGTALAIHLAKNNDVLLGSRNLEKAQSTVETIRREKNHPYLWQSLKPTENLEVVRELRCFAPDRSARKCVCDGERTFK